MSFLSNLQRNPEAVKDSIVELDDGSLITKTGCKIYIPVDFVHAKLAYIGVETSIICIFLMTVRNQFYSVSMANAMMNIEPSSIETIDIGDNKEDAVKYYCFSFTPGSVITKSTNLVKKDSLSYLVYNCIISNAKVPFYLTYDDLGKLFNTNEYFTGVNVGKNPEIMELMVSAIARDSKDRTKYYRQSVNENKNSKLSYIPLDNIAYGATSTVTKLAGSWFYSGVVSALQSPSTKVEKIEKILRA